MTRPILLGVVSLLIFAACSDAPSPLAMPAETQVNFFEASEASTIAPRGFGFIYIDRYDTTRTDDPYFVGDEYPSDVNSVGKPYERVMYMRLPSGAHRFWFTDGRRTPKVDTTLSLAAGASRVLCLTDSLGVWYRVLNIDEGSPSPSNQMRVRLVNASPDAGVLNVYAVGDTGQTVWSDLPQGTVFPSASPYATVDSSLMSRDGNVYLGIFAGADTAQRLVLAAVPYGRGRSYQVVIEGYANPETVQYPDTVIQVSSPTIRGIVRIVE